MCLTPVQCYTHNMHTLFFKTLWHAKFIAGVTASTVHSAIQIAHGQNNQNVLVARVWCKLGLPVLSMMMEKDSM